LTCFLSEKKRDSQDSLGQSLTHATETLDRVTTKLTADDDMKASFEAKTFAEFVKKEVLRLFTDVEGKKVARGTRTFKTKVRNFLEELEDEIEYMDM
jgi:hypothetical protein